MDFIRFKIDVLSKDNDSTFTQAKIATNLIESIAKIPDTLVRHLYCRDCATLLQLEESIIRDEVTKARSKFAKQTEKHTSASNSFNSRALETDFKQIIRKKERAIIQAVIRYGERILPDVSDSVISVIEHIHTELTSDNLQLQEELYCNILTDAMRHVQEEGFIANRYFMAHPDERYSKLAAELLYERYPISEHDTLSKVIFEKEETDYYIQENVQRIIIDYKQTLLSEELKRMSQTLLIPEVISDEARYTEMLTHYKTLAAVKSFLIKEAYFQHRIT